MNNSIKSKVVVKDLDAWNNKWYVYVATPILAALGVSYPRLKSWAGQWTLLLPSL
jgi:hypothetical protein